MRNLITVVTMFSLFSCNLDQNTVDREKIREELNSREIKKLSDADIQDAAFSLGQRIVNEAESIVKKKMTGLLEKAASDSSGGWDIFPPCSAFNDFLLKTYNDTLKHKVSMVSTNQFDLLGTTAEKARQLLEAYEYNDENQLPLEDNVQKLGKDFILFTQPITKLEEACTVCLDGIKSDTVFIKNPADSTSFCGMWLVKLSKKELIKSL